MNNFNKAKSSYGVGEWAPYSYNIGTGCSNGCKYCYAREIALKTGTLTDKVKWTNERVNQNKVDIQEKADGRVMFPSMHDISDNNLVTYMATLKNILKTGNQVLIVSKPRMTCIQSICDAFKSSRENILYRFTIGSLNERVCKFWEPNAPKPQERISALKYAFEAGYQTSVSAEPMLEGYREAIALYEALEPMITDTIWFGKMQEINDRVDMSVPLNNCAAQFIRDFQSDANIRRLYEALKDRPKVKWKDSIREVVGI